MMRLALLTAALAVAGCAETQPADQGPRNTSGWDSDRASDGFAPETGETAGSWHAAPDGKVQFSDDSAEAVFSIDCDLRGGLIFHRPGLVPRGSLAMMQLRTGGAVRRLAVTTPETEQPTVEARAPYSDPLVPALMRFQQPLEVRIDGLETLSLPPSPVVREFVQNCGRITGAPVTMPEMGLQANQAVPANEAAQ
ncbi:MAG TPA: hypothetical protein VNH53_11705 [Sphingomicrobium sp.]|nr:hypothetical protein [Sphingomicrobium sp.]